MYVTPAQMIVYYDERRILQLVSDDGVDAAVGDLSNTGSDAYVLLAALILATDAEIDSALQVGQRYDRLDLEAMITAADTQGSQTATEWAAAKKRASILRRLAADLTYGALIGRRGFSEEIMKAQAPRYEIAQQQLAALGDGGRIFDLDAPKTAGVPGQTRIGQNISNTVRNSPLFGVFDRGSDGGLFFFQY